MKKFLKIIYILLALHIFLVSVFLVFSGLSIWSGLGMMVFSIYIGNYALTNSATLRKRKK